MTGELPFPPRRAEQRLATSIAALYRSADGLADCEIVDFSAGGALLDADCKLAPGELLQVSIPHAGMMAAMVVAISERGFHVAFLDITPVQRETVRRLVFARLCG